MEPDTGINSISTTDPVIRGAAEITLKSVWPKIKKHAEKSPKENNLKVKRLEDLKLRAEKFKDEQQKQNDELLIISSTLSGEPSEAEVNKENKSAGIKSKEGALKETQEKDKECGEMSNR